MELLDVYKSLLSCAGMQADDEGFISVRLAKTEPKPVLIKGKRLVLPTAAQLRQPDFENRVIFHPLSESILRGESDVLAKLREFLNQRLNFIMGYVSINLLTLATSPAMHTELTPEQSIFLSKVKDADEGTVDRLKKITSAMLMGDSSKAFAHIYVRKNGTVHGKQHRRLGTVSFPFYEEVKKTPEPKHTNEIYGVKLRKIDRESFKGLMEYMIPNIATPESYFRGNEFEVAPSLEALMQAVIAVGDPVNAVVEMFKDLIEESDDLYFNGDWEETFQNLPAMLPKIRMVPMQPGNEGNAASTGAAPMISVNTNNTAAQPQPEANRPTIKAPTGLGGGEPVSTRPVVRAPADLSAVSHRPTTTLAPVTAAQVQHGYHPHVHAPAPIQQGYMPPLPYAPPVYQQQPTYQAPQLRRSEHGLDFNSVMQANPAIAAHMPGPMGYGAPMMQQPQQRVPGWDYARSGGGYAGGGMGGGFSSI